MTLSLAVSLYAICRPALRAARWSASLTSPAAKFAASPKLSVTAPGPAQPPERTGSPMTDPVQSGRPAYLVDGARRVAHCFRGCAHMRRHGLRLAPFRCRQGGLATPKRRSSRPAEVWSLVAGPGGHHRGHLGFSQCPASHRRLGVPALLRRTLFSDLPSVLLSQPSGGQRTPGALTRRCCRLRNLSR